MVLATPTILPLNVDIDLVSIVTLFFVPVDFLHQDNKRTDDKPFHIAKVLTPVLFLVLGSLGSRQRSQDPLLQVR